MELVICLKANSGANKAAVRISPILTTRLRILRFTVALFSCEVDGLFSSSWPFNLGYTSNLVQIGSGCGAVHAIKSYGGSRQTVDDLRQIV